MIQIKRIMKFSLNDDLHIGDIFYEFHRTLAQDHDNVDVLIDSFIAKFVNNDSKKNHDDCILPSTNDDYSEHKQEKTRIIEINRGTINHSLLISDESVKTQSRATDLKYLHLLQLSLNFVFFFYF